MGQRQRHLLLIEVPVLNNAPLVAAAALPLQVGLLCVQCLLQQWCEAQAQTTAAIAQLVASETQLCGHEEYDIIELL